MSVPPFDPTDPSVDAVLDALAFTAAAAQGDVEHALAIFAQAGHGTGEASFAAALTATVQLLVDEAAVAGVDVTEVLRDVGLGVQIAHLAERDDTADVAPPCPHPTTGTTDPTDPGHGDP